MINLLAAKPLAIIATSAAAVGLSACGAVLQNPAPPAPVTVTRIVPTPVPVPTVVRVPGRRTIIIKHVPGRRIPVPRPVPQ